jgi:hypothetical protein
MKELVCDTFKKIIEGSQSQTKPLPALRALGINSDLDILIDFPEGFTGDKQKVLWNLKDFINSAEFHLGLRNNKGEIKKSIVPIGDVKDYEKQLGLKSQRSAVVQGGSSLDWLAFPIDLNEPQKMRFPEGYSHILSSFLRGELEYLKSPDNMEDLDKQTVRGLRPFLEIPFLTLTDAGSQVMEAELNLLLQKARESNESKFLSSGAMEQFEKLIRNARFEGGHNRFVRGDTPSDSQIDTLVQELSLTVGKKGEKNLPLIPEFLANKKIGIRKADKGNLAIDGYLSSTEEFVKKYTDNGVIYHGTPDINTILYMIRNGLIVSNKMQGAALCGRGTYATKNLSEAEAYVGTYGIVIPFQMNNHKNLRILDLNTDKGQKLLEIAQSKFPNRDPHLVLEEIYDIDVIVAKDVCYLLLQNADAIKIPKDIKILIHAQLDKVNRELKEKLADDTYKLTAKDIEKWMEYTHPNHGYTQMMRYIDPEFSSQSFQNFLGILDKALTQEIDDFFSISYAILSSEGNFFEISNQNQSHSAHEIYKKSMEMVCNKLNNTHKVLSKLLEMQSLESSQAIKNVIEQFNKCICPNFDKLPESEQHQNIKELIKVCGSLKDLRLREFSQSGDKNDPQNFAWGVLVKPIFDKQNIDIMLKNLDILNKHNIGISDIYDLNFFLTEINKAAISSEQIEFLFGLKDLFLVNPSDLTWVFNPISNIKNPKSVLKEMTKIINKGIHIGTGDLYDSELFSSLETIELTDAALDILIGLQKLKLVNYGSLGDLMIPINALKNPTFVLDSIEKINEVVSIKNSCRYNDFDHLNIEPLKELLQKLDKHKDIEKNNVFILIKKLKEKGFLDRGREQEFILTNNILDILKLSEGIGSQYKLKEIEDSIDSLGSIDIWGVFGKGMYNSSTSDIGDYKIKILSELKNHKKVLTCVKGIEKEFSSMYCDFRNGSLNFVKMVKLLDSMPFYNHLFGLLKEVEKKSGYGELSEFFDKLMDHRISSSGYDLLEFLVRKTRCSIKNSCDFIEPVSKIKEPWKILTILRQIPLEDPQNTSHLSEFFDKLMDHPISLSGYDLLEFLVPKTRCSVKSLCDFIEPVSRIKNPWKLLNYFQTKVSSKDLQNVSHDELLKVLNYVASL